MDVFEAQTLKSEIDKTDKEIDFMVYKLYELSREEVKIVEPEFGMSEEEYNKFKV